MDSHVISALSQWFMYFLPTVVAWLRLRSGKTIPLSLGQMFLFNLMIAWTVVGWILLMINAFGYNPVPWIALRAAKVLSASGLAGQAGPMTAPQAGSFSSQGQICSQCGRLRINVLFSMPGPRKLVHAAHECKRSVSIAIMLLLHEQRPHPLPLLRRRPPIRQAIFWMPLRAAPSPPQRRGRTHDTSPNASDNGDSAIAALWGL